jgi:hypothetical protein
MALVSKLGPWEEYFSIIFTFIVGGAGFNHIINLYKEDATTFSCKLARPPMFVSFGVAVLPLAVFIGQYTHWVTQIYSAVLGLVAVALVVLGSVSDITAKP